MWVRSGWCGSCYMVLLPAKKFPVKSILVMFFSNNVNIGLNGQHHSFQLVRNHGRISLLGKMDFHLDLLVIQSPGECSVSPLYLC